MKTIRLALACLLAFAVIPRISLAADAPAKFKVSEFSFQRPAAWEWVESTSSMRAAQLKINDAKGGAGAEVIFYYFGPGNSGGTQANVDRWLGQFKEPRDQINAKIEESTVGKTKITYVQAEGTYNSGMPGGPKTPMPGHALIGAIVEGGQGSVFVRLTGPKALAKASLEDFKKMIESGLK